MLTVSLQLLVRILRVMVGLWFVQAESQRLYLSILGYLLFSWLFYNARLGKVSIEMSCLLLHPLKTPCSCFSPHLLWINSLYKQKVSELVLPTLSLWGRGSRDLSKLTEQGVDLMEKTLSWASWTPLMSVWRGTAVGFRKHCWVWEAASCLRLLCIRLWCRGLPGLQVTQILFSLLIRIVKFWGWQQMDGEDLP